MSFTSDSGTPIVYYKNYTMNLHSTSPPYYYWFDTIDRNRKTGIEPMCTCTCTCTCTHIPVSGSTIDIKILLEHLCLHEKVWEKWTTNSKKAAACLCFLLVG